MSKVNLGWIKDKNGEKYAPKTLATEVITKTGKNLEETLIEKIDSPQEAEIGQFLVVKEVDENGTPLKWETVDKPAQDLSDLVTDNELSNTLSSYVKKDQYATSSTPGIVKTSNTYGVSMSGSNLQVYKASSTDIASRTHNYRPIVPSNLDSAVKAGLANSKITWSDSDKQKARTTINAKSNIPIDWEQNTESADDYIKNRPFYLTYSNRLELLPLSNYEFVYWGLYYWHTIGDSSQEIPKDDWDIKLNKEYEINWNGTVYKLTGKSYIKSNGDENIYVGNIRYAYNIIIPQPSENTGEPFLFISNKSRQLTIVCDSKELNNGYVNLSLHECSNKLEYEVGVKQLDEKFIPDNIPKIDSASIGQTIEIEEVDENGKPIKWKAVNKGGGSGVDIEIDSELLEDSTNPIQNQAVTKEFNTFAGSIEITSNDPVKEKTVLTFNPDAEEINLYTVEEIDNKFSGTVEITDGNPSKENTVITVNPNAEEVNIYTAEEIDNKFSGTVEITNGEPVKENTVLTVNPKAEKINIYTVEEVDSLINNIKQTLLEDVLNALPTWNGGAY